MTKISTHLHPIPIDVPAAARLPSPDPPAASPWSHLAMTAKYDTFTTNFPGVTVQLDRDADQPGRGAHFAGLVAFLGGPATIPGKVRRVHVMSAHAFGEIRSYVLDEANELRAARGRSYGLLGQLPRDLVRLQHRHRRPRSRRPADEGDPRQPAARRRAPAARGGRPVVSKQ